MQQTVSSAAGLRAGGGAAGTGIANGYKFPRKQGVDDGRYIGALGLTATNVSPSMHGRCASAISAAPFVVRRLLPEPRPR